MLTEQNGIQVDKFYAPADWQYSFPEGYTRLEYLESTGTQYIIFPFQPNQDSRFIIQCKRTSTNFNSFIGSNPYMTITGWGTPATVARFRYNNNNFDFIDNNWLRKLYLFDFNKNEIYVNKTLVHTFTPATFQATQNTALFGRINNDGNIDDKSIIRIYFCQVYDDNDLKFSFIPAKRNSDNKPGMYDLVNDVFYVNQGTGEFVMGPELYSNNSQIDIRQKNNTNFVEKYKFNENNELIWANPDLYLTGKVNYTKVGNPTITDNVVSGFSGSAYLRLPDFFTVKENENFEIALKFTTPSVFNNINMYILHSGSNGLYGSENGIYLNSNGTLIFKIYSILNETTQTLLTNTTYYVKMSRIDNIITAKLSIDNENWTTLFSVSNNSAIITNTYPSFGTNITYTAIYFPGSIDLKETYITINDQLWFYGKNYTSENYAPVPAGLNYNNTTTPSIGYVNTQTQVFTPAPTDGIKYSQTRDIKVIPPEDNTITLLYGVKSDFSKYALFGLLANVSSGTYDVYIDDVLFATTASGTQTDIDFSTLGAEYVPIGTCTTPEELVLHKIVIKPSTSGETLTRFQTLRTAGATGTQAQGVMWTHFELTNNINISSLFYNNNSNNILQAVTAKGDIINTSSSMYGIFRSSNSIEYFPLLDAQEQQTANIGYAFYTTKLKRIRIKDIQTNNGDSSFSNSVLLEQINGNNINLVRNIGNYAFNDNRNLKIIPFVKNNMLQNGSGANFITNAIKLYPTKLDMTELPKLTYIQTIGSSTYPMRGLRGLKVSNQAPFSSTSSPQINVSYTGLDRDALVELFNSIPDVSEATDGITRQINITAATGNNLTKVGTPTIDENGVASGFSASDYLKLSENFTDTGKDIEICVLFKKTTTSNLPIIGVSNSYNSERPNLATNGSKVRFKIRHDVSITSNYTINTTDFYKAVVKRTKGIYTLFIYNSINQLLDKVTLESSVLIGNGSAQNFAIGFDKSTYNNSFPGSIDLENTYIKVGQNYLMKGYLTDNDRLIATNKGWTITG